MCLRGETEFAIGCVQRVELLRAMARPRYDDTAAVGLKALSQCYPFRRRPRFREMGLPPPLR